MKELKLLLIGIYGLRLISALWNWDPFRDSTPYYPPESINSRGCPSGGSNPSSSQYTEYENSPYRTVTEHYDIDPTFHSDYDEDFIKYCNDNYDYGETEVSSYAQASSSPIRAAPPAPSSPVRESSPARSSPVRCSVYQESVVYSVPPGIRDASNTRTCYMNAFLQCLYAVPEFRYFIEKTPNDGSQNTLFYILKQLFQIMKTNSGENKVISNDLLAKNSQNLRLLLPGTDIRTDHLAIDEFYDKAMDQLASEIKKIDKTAFKEFKRLVRLRYNKKTYLKQRKTEEVEIYINILSLIKDENIKTLKQAIEDYPSRLCDAKAASTIKILRAPKMLVFQIQRYYWFGDRCGYLGDLDIEETIEFDHDKYRLYAVALRRHDGPTSGHWYAHIIAKENGNISWYKADNAVIEKLSWKNHQKGIAERGSLFFYQKED